MSEISVEMTGETVGEAKWAAVRELERMHPGLDKAAVRFQVVTEGERGLLGVGYEPARVVASLDEEAAPARGFVESARREGESDDADASARSLSGSRRRSACSAPSRSRRARMRSGPFATATTSGC
jgi:predicted RNA-binding protein Jag